MALADVVNECQEPCASQYDETTIQYLDDRIQALSADCIGELLTQGFRRLGFCFSIVMRKPAFCICKNNGLISAITRQLITLYIYTYKTIVYSG